MGRMISAYKIAPDGCFCVFNANVITRNQNKVWYGDLNITREELKLKKIAQEIGEPLYVLREMDCRFDGEKDSIETLISKAVWSTE